MSRKFYLVAYDISNQTTLHTIRKKLKAYAIGGQKSFYECWITNTELAELTTWLNATIENATDKIHIFQLDPRLSPLYFGTAKPIRYSPFMII